MGKSDFCSCVKKSSPLLLLLLLPRVVLDPVCALINIFKYLYHYIQECSSRSPMGFRQGLHPGSLI